MTKVKISIEEAWGKNSPFPLEINEKSDKGGRFAIEFVRFFFDFYM
ncbi:hypothetical protein [Ligilactobacillus ruminis]|nr:hypothetical protein [Ligilactobacillus ruminis]